MARRPRGAGSGRSPLPAISSKASGFVAPGLTPRSQSCDGEKGSGASFAASRTSPAYRPACVWGSVVKAGLKMEGVLRYCWFAVFDSYVCGNEKNE